MLLLALVLYVGCEASLPEHSECFTVNGKDYRGSVNHAGAEEVPCLYWNQTVQHRFNTHADPSGELGLGSHNHCRNPDSDVQPWCYVSETEDGQYWKFCDIPTCHMPGYIGCFVDYGSPPALSGTSGTSGKLTVQTCIQFCRIREYQYAGLEAGYACFCGGPSDVAALQRVSGSRCDHTCFGKASEVCGFNRMGSVFLHCAFSAAWIGACSGNFSSMSGVLYSPDYPDEYSPDRTCRWDIRIPGAAAIEMEFHIFHVEDPNDILEVRDKQDGSLLIQINGGQDPPNAITFPTGGLQITFTSDRTHNGQGFVMTYKGLMPESEKSAAPVHVKTKNSEFHIPRCLVRSLWTAGPGPGR
ncbi:PREDICTED: kremen protein 2-like [Nanorana parkeri]|uniref:kremen protein 2-like n=1 Tax=Nanorana parkeri TaxID=125878 RepID=UPI0008548EDD|nr:PREDICTED: kremen protein 2-like [Nanorana parkeri]